MPLNQYLACYVKWYHCIEEIAVTTGISAIAPNFRFVISLLQRTAVPWSIHLAGLSPALSRHRNAAIDKLSLLMAVTRVTLYRLIRQLALTRAVVSCMKLCISSRYSTYLYLNYVRLPIQSSLKCYLCLIFFVHFVFEWKDDIPILPYTGGKVLWWARIESTTSRTAPAFFPNFYGSLLCLIRFSFWFVIMVLYSCLSLLCDFYPLSCEFPKTPLL